MVNITKYISENDLNKKISLDGTKSSNAQFYSGKFETVTISNVEDLEKIIKKLKSNESIGLGVNKYNKKGEITTNMKDKLKSRTKDNFEWNEETHLVLLDYDYFPGLKEINNPEEYRNVLIDIDPIFEDVEMLIIQSSSSNIYKGEKLLLDSKGIHCYFIIEGSIEVFLDKLWSSCWLKGYGKIRFSKSGSILSRNIFDKSVFSPERLIFETTPLLEEGLTRLDIDNFKIGTKNLIVEDMEDNISDGKRIEELAKFESKSKSKIKQNNYIEKETDKLVKKGIKKEEAFSIIMSKTVNNVIFDSELIHLLDGTKILAKDLTEEHNGIYCLDPIEPDKAPAIINIDPKGSKSIWSFLHGGKTFHIQQPYLVTELDISNEAKVLAKNYKEEKWEREYENYSNKEMYENWEILFQSYLNATSEKFLNKMYLLGVGAGNGKSTTLGYYIGKKIIPEKKSALIVVTTIQAAVEMKDSINEILKKDNIKDIEAKTLFNNNKGFKSDITQKESNQTNILIITHNKLQHDLNYNKEQSIRTYNGMERDLIVIDEAIDFAETATININRLYLSIAYLDNYIRFNKSNKEAEYLANGIKQIYDSLMSLDGNEHRIFDAKDIFKDYSDLKVSKELKKELENITADFNMSLFLDDLEILSRSEDFTIDTGQSGYLISSSVDRLPQGKGILILDASASINHEYNHYISKRKAERIKVNEKAKSYENVNVYYKYVKGVTGKLNPKSKNESIQNEINHRKELLIHEINDKTTEEDKILIIANKDFIEDVEEMLFIKRNVNFGYWGNLTGRNDLRECNKIFILSLPYKPIITSKNVTHKHNVLGNHTEELLFKNTNIIDDVYQALMRGILRTTEENTANSPSCDVYLVLPTNKINFTDKLKSKINNLLLDSKELEWDFYVDKNNNSLFKSAPSYKPSDTLKRILDALNIWDKYNGHKTEYVQINNLDVISDIKNTAIGNALSRKIGYGINKNYSGLDWILDNSDDYSYISYKDSKKFLEEKGIKVHGRVGNIFYKNKTNNEKVV